MWRNLSSIQKIRLLLIGFVLCVVGLVAWYIFDGENKKYREGIVYVSNMSDCSNGIQSEKKYEIFDELYALVKEVNDYNKKNTLKNYQATIRDNSCKELKRVNNVVTTSSIIDIPQTQQSWNITYVWVAHNADEVEDLGNINPTCLEKDLLIYSDFKCQEALNFKKYGTSIYDPILPHVPYLGGAYIIRFTPDTKDVSVVFIVDEIYRNNNSIVNVENLKGSIVTWFENRELDINTYKVSYFIEYKKKATVSN